MKRDLVKANPKPKVKIMPLEQLKQLDIRSTRVSTNNTIFHREDEFFKISNLKNQIIEHPKLNAFTRHWISKLINVNGNENKFNSVEDYLAHGFKILTEKPFLPELKSEYKSLHWLYLLQSHEFWAINSYNEIDKNNIAMYGGETHAIEERCGRHSREIAIYLLMENYDDGNDNVSSDGLFAQKLVQNLFYYSHVGLPRCEIGLVRFFEQMIIHSIIVVFGEKCCANIKVNSMDQNCTKYGIANEDTFAIGSVFIANLLADKPVFINVFATTITTQTSEYGLICSICKTNVRGLLDHLITVHQLDSKKALEIYANTERILCTNEAKGCLKEFVSKGNLKDHLDNSCRFVEDAIECSHGKCGQTLHPKQWELHLKICGYARNGDCKCPNDCGWSCFKCRGTNRALKWHLALNCPNRPQSEQTNETNEIHTFECAKCFKKFPTKIQKNEHVRKKYCVENSQVQCDHCKSILKNKESLKSHFRMKRCPGENGKKKKDDGKERNHKCEQCEAAYVQKKHLNRHKKKNNH